MIFLIYRHSKHALDMPLTVEVCIQTHQSSTCLRVLFIMCSKAQRYRGMMETGLLYCSGRSDRFSSNVARQRLVMWSFFRSCEKVASRNGVGRQERRASRALGLSLSRK